MREIREIDRLGNHTIGLCPAAPADDAFLRAVYASTREAELAHVPWDEAAKQAFLAMQFNAQHQDYHANYPDAAFDVVLVDGETAGRLYVDRGEEILLIDVALLPAYRRLGVGTHLLRSLLAEAGEAGKPVRLHVETFNPVRRLYERLGFTVVEEGIAGGLYLEMKWTPPSQGEPA